MKKNVNLLPAMAAWIEEGGRGTSQEIADHFGISKDSAYYRLRALRDKGVADVVQTRPAAPSRFGRHTPDADVWGRASDKPVCDEIPDGIVARAIAARPYLETAWMQSVEVRA